ncbi:unnamed protein product, partial [Sphacelaria rigidula]
GRYRCFGRRRRCRRRRSLRLPGCQWRHIMRSCSYSAYTVGFASERRKHPRALPLDFSCAKVDGVPAGVVLLEERRAAEPACNVARRSLFGSTSPTSQNADFSTRQLGPSSVTR